MNSQPLLPIFTESMAELAWRYGDAGIPIRFHRLVLGVRWFADGSCRSRLGVDTPRGVRHALDRFRDRWDSSEPVVDGSAA